MHAIILQVVASMAKGSYYVHTRRSGRRVTRGVQLQCTSYDDDRPANVNANDAPRNIVEDDHVTSADVNMPSTT